jgi:hypothetical protein
VTLAELTEVWSPLSVLAAAIPGFLLGYLLLGRFAADPAYASGDATPLDYGVLTAILTAATGLIFYGFQIITSLVDGDTHWTRVVSRYAIWVLYSLAIGIGLWLRLHRHIAARHAAAHERAVAELAANE